MINILEAIFFGFKEVLRWDIMKYILIGGTLISLLWIFVGYIVWSPLMSVSNHLLDLLPFALLRSDGAWLLSSMLWLQLILVTFALIYAFFGNFVLLNLSKEKYTKFSFLTILGSTIFWSFVWSIYGGEIHQEFLKFLNWLPFETVQKGMSIFMGIYFLYSGIIISSMFLASFFSEPILEKVEKKNFAVFNLIKNNEFKTITFTIKNSLIYLGLSILLFPLMFVPLLNFIVLVALWIWLTKDTFKYDAATLLFEKIDKKGLKRYNKAITIISFFVVLLNFVPILNLFSPFVGLISIYYYMRRSIYK